MADTIGKLTLRSLAKALFQFFGITAATPIGFDSTGKLTNVSIAGKMATDGSNAALPTVEPAAAGKLWNDTGTVKVSTGTP